VLTFSSLPGYHGVSTTNPPLQSLFVYVCLPSPHSQPTRPLSVFSFRALLHPSPFVYVRSQLFSSPVPRTTSLTTNKAFALTWYRDLKWYSSPAQPFTAPDDPLLVTGQQRSPSPACRQLSGARNECAESSSEESTKFSGEPFANSPPTPPFRQSRGEALEAQLSGLRVNPNNLTHPSPCSFTALLLSR